MTLARRARPWVLSALTVTGVAVLAQSQGRIIEGTLAAEKSRSTTSGRRHDVVSDD